MLSDIGLFEVLVVIVVALFVFGPERLPGMARQAGGWMRDLRRMVGGVRKEFSEELGLDQDLKISDLDPRSYIRRNVLDGLDDIGLDDDKPKPARASQAPRSPEPPSSAETPGTTGATRFDDDAT